MKYVWNSKRTFKVTAYLYISSWVVHPHSPVHTHNGNFQVCWYKQQKDHMAASGIHLHPHRQLLGLRSHPDRNTAHLCILHCSHSQSLIYTGCLHPPAHKQHLGLVCLCTLVGRCSCNQVMNFHRLHLCHMAYPKQHTH